MVKKDKRKKLITLKKKMENDKSLPLRSGSTNLVFGQGNIHSPIMFIGEGPGYWEDKKALPFVGNAGALLNQLLRSIELPREEVFITNVVHHRPPSNRDPLPEELSSYGKYLDKMIDIINPSIIVTLGRFSMAKFISGVTITNVHGQPREVIWKERKIMIIPMYHPAAGLRNGEIKRRLFSDFKKIPEIMKGAGEYKEKTIEKMKDSDTEQMSLV
jgi:DNA polymerase